MTLGHIMLIAVAMTLPTVGDQLFVHDEAIEPLVRIRSLETFDDGAGGTLDGRVAAVGGTWEAVLGAPEVSGGAVVAPGGARSVAVLRPVFDPAPTAVLVGATIREPDANPSSGVVMFDGAAGRVEVHIVLDGSDHRVEVAVVDGLGTTPQIRSDPLAGALDAVTLRAEYRGGRLMVWVGGDPVLDWLAGPAVTGLDDQSGFGVVVQGDADEVDDLELFSLR